MICYRPGGGLGGGQLVGRSYLGKGSSCDVRARENGTTELGFSFSYRTPPPPPG